MSPDRFQLYEPNYDEGLGAPVCRTGCPMYREGRCFAVPGRMSVRPGTVCEPWAAEALATLITLQPMMSENPGLEKRLLGDLAEEDPVPQQRNIPLWRFVFVMAVIAWTTTLWIVLSWFSVGAP